MYLKGIKFTFEIPVYTMKLKGNKEPEESDYSHLDFVSHFLWISVFVVITAVTEQRRGRRLGVFSSVPKKTVREHYTRPESQRARRQRWTPPGTPYLLTGQHGRRSGLLGLLFWFLSRPGTVAIGDSHILALGWLWPLFHLKLFFFFNEFPLVFPDTVHGWNSGVIVSKFPGPVQGQEPVV